MLDFTRATSPQPPRSGDPAETSSERFPRDVRSSFDDESSPGRTTALQPHHTVRSRPLTGISEGDENRLSNQQGFPGEDGSLAVPRMGQHNPFDDRQSIATDQVSFASGSNVIPIAFVPSEPTPVKGIGASAARGASGNAQTALEAAREKALKTGRLKVGIAAPPSRPARSPDLDLRLNPQNKGRMDTNIMETLASAGGDRNDNAYRLSVNTTRSVAPSFFSGTSEFAATGMDAPMIMTSKQVQLGIRQAAEVVHISPNTGTGTAFSPSAQYLAHSDERVYEDDLPTPRAGGPLLAGQQASGTSSSRPDADDPFSDAHDFANDHTARLQPQRSTATFGGGARDHHLSRQSSAFALDDGRSAVSTVAGGGDLRFSMGSLAESNIRDSISTQGTGAVVGEARKINLGGAIGGRPPTAWQTRGSTNLMIEREEEDHSLPLARPRPGFAEGQDGQSHGARESMMSGRSDDSFLNAIIPPKFAPVPGESPAKTPYSSSNLAQKLPTSMSTETFSSGALFGVASPGKRYPPPPQMQSPSHSVGQNPLASESRHTLGLSGFEFQIGDDEERDAAFEELPPLPTHVSRPRE